MKEYTEYVPDYEKTCDKFLELTPDKETKEELLNTWAKNERDG